MTGRTASAGPALDEETGAPVSTAASAGEQVEYGVGLRLRNVRIPKGELELFVERAGDSGASNFGFGIELIRRRGDLELQIGIEKENISPGGGVWIERGKTVPTDVADYVLDADDATEKLGWITFEFTFLKHSPITKQLAVRYGAGAGLGIITGSLQHYNVICAGGATNEAPEPGCRPMALGGQASPEDDGTPKKYDLPPVFPVVNAIIGLQFKPTDKITVNFETGIRTVLFLGLSGAYFF